MVFAPAEVPGGAAVPVDEVVEEDEVPCWDEQAVTASAIAAAAKSKRELFKS